MEMTALFIGMTGVYMELFAIFMLRLGVFV